MKSDLGEDGEHVDSPAEVGLGSPRLYLARRLGDNAPRAPGQRAPRPCQESKRHGAKVIMETGSIRLNFALLKGVS